MMPFANKRFKDFGLILTLFVSARLMMLMTWPAEDLTLYGDYRFYFDLGALSDVGYVPFIHYWTEYPPVFPFLNLPLYWLSGGIFKNYVLLTGLVLLIFEAGTLSLLYRMATDIHSDIQAARIGWVYIALFVPSFIWLRSYEAMTACFVLLALFALRRGRLWLTGLVIGLGAMTKYVPIVLLATVWRTHGWRAVVVSGLVVLLVSVACLGPLLALSPSYTMASVLAQPSKSSWQTIWALIDGNIGNTGNLGPIVDHFDPAKARQMLHSPSRLPVWLTLVPFALLGLFILTRPRVRGKEDGLIFTALTFTILFLWSKGWSPQWQLFLIPLLLLTLPLGRAAMFVIVLGFVNLLEWPVILSRGITELLPLTIVARTLVFVLLAWELYQQMRKPAMGE
jgi:hypothetical protein